MQWHITPWYICTCSEMVVSNSIVHLPSCHPVIVSFAQQRKKMFANGRRAIKNRRPVQIDLSNSPLILLYPPFRESWISGSWQMHLLCIRGPLDMNSSRRYLARSSYPTKVAAFARCLHAHDRPHTPVSMQKISQSPSPPHRHQTPTILSWTSLRAPCGPHP